VSSPLTGFGKQTSNTLRRMRSRSNTGSRGALTTTSGSCAGVPPKPTPMGPAGGELGGELGGGRGRGGGRGDGGG
jgi:hypothetical protein